MLSFLLSLTIIYGMFLFLLTREVLGLLCLEEAGRIVKAKKRGEKQALI